MIVGGTIKSLGILFLHFSAVLNDDLVKIAWIGTTFSLCITLLGEIFSKTRQHIINNMVFIILTDNENT